MSKPAATLRKVALFSTSALAFTATILGAPAAFAQDSNKLEDIVITASRQGETILQNTPIAVTAFDDAALQARGVSNVQGLVGYTPGLQISDLGGYAQLYIRGVGSNIVFIGSDPSSTVHMDGVYLARPLSYLSDFLDVERVEVLRGPQGTLYGRNAVGGTINIISRKPSDKWEGEIRGSVGDYSAYGVSGYVSGPLTESGIKASLAVSRKSREPFRKNVSTGGGVEDEDFWGIRGQLLLPVTSKGELTLRFDHTNTDGSLSQYPKLISPTGLPLDDSVLKDFTKVSTNDASSTIMTIDGAAAEFNYDITDALKFKSLTSFRKFRGSIAVDADSSSLQILRNYLGPIHQEQVSQEFSVTGNYEKFNFVAGAFYFREQNKEPLTLAAFPYGGSHIQRPKLSAESYALFAQGEYFLTDALSVVVGARWTKETKNWKLSDYWTTSLSLDPTVAAAAPINPFLPPAFQVSTSRDSDAFTPKFGVNYRLDHALLYASATRGYKSGGFDYGSSNAVDSARGYDPEYLWAYEVGAKTDWFDKRLRANVTAFYYDYTDLQVQSYANFLASTQNAANAEVKGVELELTAKPVPSVDLFANVSYLDATYSDYKGAYTNLFGPFDASGKTLNNSPEWSFAVGGTYTHNLGDLGEAYIGADVRYQSEVFFSAANEGVNGVTNYPQMQDDYALVNGRVGWRSKDGDWEGALIGTNLTDEEYILGTADYVFFAGRVGAPRQLTFQVSRKF
jgi:iron complex outermembrane recepter protein